MVSGMLTAIRDFVQDSFRVADSESLEALKVGELSVWIEQGPRAIIAAVLRGTAPRTLPHDAADGARAHPPGVCRRVRAVQGRRRRVRGARPTLDACLHTEYRANDAAESPDAVGRGRDRRSSAARVVGGFRAARAHAAGMPISTR